MSSVGVRVEEKRLTGLQRIGAILGIAAMLTIVLARAFLIHLSLIPTSSMAPTARAGDGVVINTFVYHVRPPSRGDVIIFRSPPEAGMDGQLMIKRVIGLPGDRIAIREGQLLRNGRAVREKYLAEPTTYTFPAGGGEFVVPDGKLFVLGDNRNISNDSHIWGPLSQAAVLGQAVFIYRPWSHMRGLK